MIYVLKDSMTDTYISRGDNFNTNWMSLIQSQLVVKFAPSGMDDFVDGDVVVIYLDGHKPYGSYKIPAYVKKLFIVGRINKQNVGYLSDADFIVYTNDIQRRIVENVSGVTIKCKSYVMPKHPTPTFFNIDIHKQNRLFIGGRFTSEKTTGLYSRLLKLHETYPKDVNFYVMGIDDSMSFKSYTDSLTNWLVESPLNGNRLVKLEFKAAYYRILQAHIAASKYIHLWRDEPTIDAVMDMLDRSDKEILNYSIGESALLGIATRFGCEIDVEPTISFIAHFSEPKSYEFDDFAADMYRILCEIQ